jgi:EAL domain-containing protein (putative c-di-GMP-specific phosphodiesterase class I)
MLDDKNKDKTQQKILLVTKPRSDISLRFDRTAFQNETLLDDLDIHFQPIVDLVGGSRILGFEALGRKTGAHGITSIGPLLKDIHDAGLRPELEMRALQAARNFIRLCDENLDHAHASNVYVTVNLHHLTLAQPKLLQGIENQILDYPSAQPRIRFEILEHPFPRRAHGKIMENIRALSAEGYKLYLDDFGDHAGIDEDRLEDTKQVVTGIKLSSSLWQRDEEDRHRFLDYLASPDLQGKIIVLEGIETDEQIAKTMQMPGEYGFTKVLAQGWHPLLGASMSPESAVELLGQLQKKPQENALEK